MEGIVASLQAKNLSRFMVVPYISILPPAPTVMLPAQPTEDEHRMKGFFYIDDNQEDDCIASINLIKVLKSPYMKNQFDVQLASIPLALNKLYRILQFPNLRR